MERLNLLLKKISEIVLKEKTQQEEKRKRGENFNVFKVLGLSTSEIRLHSAFIAELLNPNGDHGLENHFLDSFVAYVINSKRPFLFDSKSAKVYVEYFIGNITSDYKGGGRIDLLIHDKNRQTIIIENKIYADDQPLQMYRYNEYASVNLTKRQYVLLYLTLNGSQPSEESLGEDPIDYLCISYKEDILPWLEHCIGISALFPRIRETISQYKSNLYSILDIMSTTTEKDMLNQLICKDNIEATLNILSLDNVIKTTIRRDFLAKLIGELQPFLDKHDIAVDLTKVDGMAKLSNYNDIQFYRVTHQMIHFTLGVEGKQVWYGITVDQDKHNPNKKVMPISLWEYKPQGNLPYGWEYFKGDLRYWDGKVALIDMVKGHEIIDIIRGELQKVIEYNAFEKLEKYLTE